MIILWGVLKKYKADEPWAVAGVWTKLEPCKRLVAQEPEVKAFCYAAQNRRGSFATHLLTGAARVRHQEMKYCSTCVLEYVEKGGLMVIVGIHNSPLPNTTWIEIKRESQGFMDVRLPDIAAIDKTWGSYA